MKGLLLGGFAVLAAVAVVAAVASAVMSDAIEENPSFKPA